MKAGSVNNPSFSKTRAKSAVSETTLRNFRKCSIILVLGRWRANGKLRDYEKIDGKVRIFARCEIDKKKGVTKPDQAGAHPVFTRLIVLPTVSKAVVSASSLV